MRKWIKKLVVFSLVAVITGILAIPVNATEYGTNQKSQISNTDKLEETNQKNIPNENLTVSEASKEETKDKKEKIPITDLEIFSYESELEVNAIMNLNVTILPSDATNQTIHYRSSNPEVATVNSKGEVKGIMPGIVTIYVESDGVTKEVNITVKIRTKTITLESKYIILKPGEQFHIQAKVIPDGADGNLTYTSSDTRVITVSRDGIITAQTVGKASIIVKNTDSQAAIVVIVNQTGTVPVSKVVNEVEEDKTFTVPKEVKVLDYPVLSAEILRYLYNNKKSIEVQAEKYTLIVDGQDIVNTENQMYTTVEFEEKANGFSFVINGGKPLCGLVTLNIDSMIEDEKYLYLYNEEKDQYQFVNVENVSCLKLTTAGKYYITNKKLNSFHIRIEIIVAGIAVLIFVIGIYIVAKKRYWFW